MGPNRDTELMGDAGTKGVLERRGRRGGEVMGGKVPSVKHDLRTNVAANKDHSISCRISS